MTTIVVIVVIVILAALAVGAYGFLQKRRTDQLRERFGPEYDRTVEEYGDRRTAEPVLLAREKRVRSLEIQPLSEDDRARFADAWRAVQTCFVDDPSGAVGDADRLVAEVMQARGYPVDDVEQRVSDISVDHPDVVEYYRAAHEIALRQAQGEATTEDLRKAMVHYRSLFADLLEVPEPEEAQVQP